MPPKSVFILRHAEKPYEADDASLTLRGRRRAAAYSVYFCQNMNPAFPKLDAIFAAANPKSSHRPMQTVKPLAAALGIDVNATYADKDVGALATFLLGDASVREKIVLVCWHHGNIPALAGELTAKAPTEHWPGSVFDQMWQIDFADGAASLAVHELALLYQD